MFGRPARLATCSTTLLAITAWTVTGCSTPRQYQPNDGGAGRGAAGSTAAAASGGVGGMRAGTGGTASDAGLDASSASNGTGGGGGMSAGTGGATFDAGPDAPNSGASGGILGVGTGGAGTGGAATSGAGTGGAAGAGGRVTTGGAGTGGAGTGGRAATGGAGTGGAGTGGAAGQGGGTACSPGATQCSGSDLKSCGSNGQWGAASSCGSHSACTGSSGTAKCTCTADPVCKSLGNICSGTTALANCAMDANGCFYQASLMTCADGACSGNACCINACTAGATQSSGCGTQSCQMGANGCRAWSMPTGSCGSSLVCERYSGPICADPNWAEWQVPADSPSSYTDNGDGTITDNVTKLMWQKAVASGTFTQPAALAYCPTTTTGGHDDWRLPSVVELFSIVDHTVSSGATLNAVFDAPTADQVSWTSTVVAGSPSNAWSINFYAGSASWTDTATKIVVRCVR